MGVYIGTINVVMKELGKIVAENLIKLRKKHNLTQQDLADRLAYSDKTVSKWELGKAIPGVDVLKELADFYGVTVDYLISENEIQIDMDKSKTKVEFNNHIIMLALVALTIYLIATVIFVWTCISQNLAPNWQVYLWSSSLVFFVSAILIRKWWAEKKIAWLVFASLFVWTLITSFYFQFFDQNVWYIFIIGAPLEAILILLMMMRKK